jgi:calcium-dependent protein kinase
MGSSQSKETQTPQTNSSVAARDTTVIERTNVRKNYRTIKVWKENRFSTISSVYCITDKKKYALKQLLKSGLDDEEKKSLREEVEILMLVDHPNIMKIKKLIETRTSYDIVSKYINGKNLLQVIKEKTLTTVDAISILNQILLAINHCHKKNIIHRNLTPENILITNYNITDIENTNSSEKIIIRELKNIVKVIDFGIAEKLNESRKFIHFMGNPPYTAPEMHDEIYGKECDVWSAGIIFFLMLSSKKFEKAFLIAKKQKELYKEIDRMNYDDNIKQLIRDMLKKNPNDRISAENALKNEIFKFEGVKDIISDVFTNEKAKRMKRFQSLGQVEKTILTYISKFIFNDKLNRELTILFKQIDENNDGMLSSQEMIDALKKSKIDPVIGQDINDRISLMKDGMINYSEFIASMRDWNIADEMGYFEKAFNEYDIDKSGVLDLNELKRNMPTISESDLQRFIGEADKNGDGKINLSELKEHIMKKVSHKVIT